MNQILLALIVMGYSYLFGCVTGAYYVVNLYLKKDIREEGSGNAGATNAGRVLGKKGFLLTVLIDAVKAFAAFILTDLLTGGNESMLAISAVFLIIGHLFPFQLQFKGGKGVVAYLAAALYLAPLSFLLMAILMGAAFLIFRRYTLSGFLAMGSIPLTAWWMAQSISIPAGLALSFIIVAAAHKK